MRNALLYLILAGVCQAQTAVTRASGPLDINGRPLPIGDVVEVTGPGGAKARVESTQTLNGRTTTAERVDEKVLSDDGTTRVTERTVQRYDPNGNALPPEKVRTETRKTGDGSSVATTQVYRGDLNGNLALSEKAVVTTQKSGNTTNVDMVIQQQTLNGSFSTVERRNAVSTQTGDRTQETVTTSRADSNGGFSPVLKQVIDRTSTKTGVTETRAEFETNSSGAFKLSNQYVTRTQKQPDGSEYTVVDVYSTSVPGRTQDANAKPQLLEQAVVEKKVGSGGSVTETVSARRPDPSDPNKMGALQPVSTRVCSGNCVPK